ncbi:MAG: DNA polymerase IV [Planctomycetota bacterium]
MTDERTILHVDLDAFFASVEQLDDPALRGKPVLVGGSGPRGVVAAASYEAREFGCRSAMPTAVAKRLCPHAVVVRGRFERYRELSDQVFEILHTATPLVQPLSIDEGFLDVSGSRRLLGEGRVIAEMLRERIKRETGLVASVGVAPNKFLAKLASDLDKPDGLVVIEPGTEREVLAPLPISRLPGVGPAAEKTLHRLGVRTIGDVAAMPESVLDDRLGSIGASLYQRAMGRDDRPVVTDREAKSIGHEQTFGVNLEDPDAVRAVLSEQVEAVARRLRKKGRAAKTVTVKIRYGDFETITRSGSLDERSDTTDAIWAAARSLFDTWAQSGFRSVRLIGVSVSHLGEPGGEQAGLFEQETQRTNAAADAALDAIASKFGTGAIKRGRSLASPSSRHDDRARARRARDAGDREPGPAEGA